MSDRFCSGPERGFGTVTLPHDGMWAFDIALSRRSFSRRVRLRRRVLSLPKESRYGRGCATSGFTGHQIGQATVCPTGRSVQDMALCLDSRRLDDLAEAASSCLDTGCVMTIIDADLAKVATPTLTAMHTGARRRHWLSPPLVCVCLVRHLLPRR